jgi:hypothetical protein
VELMTTDPRTWTGRLQQRLRCCICGEETAGAEDYVLLELTSGATPITQWLGAHAGHLDDELAAGFRVEVID